MAKNLFIWLVITTVLIALFSNFGPHHPLSREVAYSEFLQEVQDDKITSVVIDDKMVTASTKNHQGLVTYIPLNDSSLLKTLVDKKIKVEGKAPEEDSLLLRIFVNWFPMILLIAVWIFIMRQMHGGKSGPLSFGRSKARLVNASQLKVTFADVAGVDEAKEEVSELVDFLKNTEKYSKLGGKIPRGVLLVGSPGTGKTLLAKAVAGEAKVPFFSISGSDFVEMFVGVGASRVRDLFESAKKNAPCIIFIDEIDAVGRHRGAGLGGGHDEREQTLNQLLVEMDGFEGKEGVIVIAATNRPDVLDPALLRPGRFDRQVVVPLPDLKGRKFILEVHLKKLKLAENIDVEAIAKSTPGFSGADLANLVNEAALIAARKNHELVSMADLEAAKDKVMMGAERKSMVMSEHEKALTAYHEAGHAIVGIFVPEHDPVYKVSIIPRGRALGVTMYIPEEDRHSYTKRRIESQIAGLLGGRLAEEMIFGEDSMTTGASNDIERATDLAKQMVTKWGLSSLGPINFGGEDGEVFLGRSLSTHKTCSERMASEIDREIKNIVDKGYQEARKILEEHQDNLKNLAEALIEFETVTKEEIDAILRGEKIVKEVPAQKEKIAENDEKKPEENSAENVKTAGEEKEKIENDLKNDAPQSPKEEILGEQNEKGDKKNG